MQKTELRNETVNFLSDLPNIEHQASRRTLLLRAALDQGLRQRINIEENTDQFVILLVNTLEQYGCLEDGRLAIVAVLEAAKEYVGEKKRAYCDTLIQEWQPSPKLIEIEFVNRLNEIAFITNIDCPPYLLLSAPMGYGKTRLLKAVKDALQKQKWLCVHLELLRTNTYSFEELTTQILQQLGEQDTKKSDVTTPQRTGTKIARCMLKALNNFQQQNILMLLDSVESLEEGPAKQFLNQCIPSLQEVLSRAYGSIKLRIIFAGRYIAHWKQWGAKIPLQPISLTPFDFSAVYQTVENFEPTSGFRMESAYKQEFVAHLMYFTGGHPGCMVDILRKDYGYPINLVLANEQENYDTIVKPVIEEIQRHIPPKLQNRFKKLSVFRKYNYRLLKKIIDGELCEYKESARKLEKSLTTTSLVERKDGFIQDEIVRRLLAIRFRQVERESFITLCQKAKDIYKQDLQQTISRPEIIAVEGIYQELQVEYHQEEQPLKTKQALQEKFFAKDGILYEYLELLANRPDATDSIADLIRLLEDGNRNWEFRFVINFFLKAENQYNEEPYQHMLAQVKAFFNRIEEKEE